MSQQACAAMIGLPEGFDVSKENPEVLEAIPVELQRKARRRMFLAFALLGLQVAVLLLVLLKIIPGRPASYKPERRVNPLPAGIEFVLLAYKGFQDSGLAIGVLMFFVFSVGGFGFLLPLSVRARKSPVGSIKAFYKGLLHSDDSMEKSRPWFCLTGSARSRYQGCDELLKRWAPFHLDFISSGKKGTREEKIVSRGFVFRGAHEVVRMENLALVEARLKRADCPERDIWLDRRAVVQIAGRWYLLDGEPHFSPTASPPNTAVDESRLQPSR